MTANIDRSMRKEVYRRDGFRCALCDSTDGLQIHHIHPRGQGGANHPMNLICLCWRCHNAAHGSMMDDSYLGLCEDDSLKSMSPRRRKAAVMTLMENAIAEYMGDYYAEQGEIWYPWDG